MKFFRQQQASSTRRDYSGFLPEGGRFDNKGEYVIDCPNCGGKNKLYWNLERRLGHCFGVHPDGLKCELESIIGEQAYREAFDGGVGEMSPVLVASRKTVLPTTNPLAPRPMNSEICAWDFAQSRHFLSQPLEAGGRALTERQVREVPIGGDGQAMWVQLDPLSKEYPIVKFERPADGSGKWLPSRTGINKAAYVFGLREWLKRGNTHVVFVEGVFDVLSPDLYGLGVAVMGSVFPEALSPWLWDLICSGRSIQALYWRDWDPAGISGENKALASLKGWGVPITAVMYPGKHPKEVAPAEARAFLREKGGLIL